MLNLSVQYKTPRTNKMRTKKFEFTNTKPIYQHDSGDEDIPDEFSPDSRRHTNQLTVTRKVRTQQFEPNLAYSFQHRNSLLLKSKITMTK